MAHAPQHPHNPCSLDENERIPAKIWESPDVLPDIAWMLRDRLARYR